MAEITDKNYPEFKKAYRQALAKKEETFSFGDQEVLCAYAKYVCEYIDGLAAERAGKKACHG